MYEYRCRVVRVLDGDTVLAEIDLGFRISYRTPIRLAGLDAPELHRGTPDEKARGLAAKQRLEELAKLQPTGIVATSLDPFEKYGRVLGRLTLGSMDITQTMIHEGLARPRP